MLQQLSDDTKSCLRPLSVMLLDAATIVRLYPPYHAGKGRFPRSRGCLFRWHLSMCTQNEQESGVDVWHATGRTCLCLALVSLVVSLVFGVVLELVFGIHVWRWCFGIGVRRWCC